LIIKTICIVGLGKHGLYQIQLLRKYRSDIEISHIVDNSLPSYYRSLNFFKGNINSLYHSNIENVLSDNHPDVIYISTLADSHVQIALDIIKRGFEKTIIIEKPLSNSLKNALELRHKLSKTNWKGKIYLGFYKRFNEVLKSVKQITKSKKLGNLLNITHYGPVEISRNGSHWIDFANWINSEERSSIIANLDWEQLSSRRGSGIPDPLCDLELTYSNKIQLYITPYSHPNYPNCSLLLKFDEGEIRLNSQSSENKAKIVSLKENFEIDIPDSKEKSFIGILSGIEESNTELPSINEGLDTLETVIAAHVSDKYNGKEIRLPLDPLQQYKSLTVA